MEIIVKAKIFKLQSYFFWKRSSQTVLFLIMQNFELVSSSLIHFLKKLDGMQSLLLFFIFNNLCWCIFSKKKITCLVLYFMTSLVNYQFVSGITVSYIVILMEV